MSEFWDDMNEVYAVESAIDHHLLDHELDGEHFKQVQQLTEKDRKAKSLGLPVEAGTRVRFVANLGSVLSYPDPPDDKMSKDEAVSATGWFILAATKTNPFHYVKR